MIIDVKDSPMTEDDVLHALEVEENAAATDMGSDLSAERERAIQFYHGKIDVPAPEGRSSFISTDVRDAIDGMLPDLIDIFLASEDVVRFDPVGPEDEDAAHMRTLAANHIFHKQNPGTLVMYEWFKAALMEKNACVKSYWDSDTQKSLETYEGLNDKELYDLVSGGGVRVVEHEGFPMPAMPGMPPINLHNVRVEVTNTEGKVCIRGIPSEEFLISARHNSLDTQDSPFTAHRRNVTGSELMAMGIDPARLDLSPGAEDRAKNSPEYNARRRYGEEQLDSPESSDPAMRTYALLEASIRLDRDRDGYAELRRVIRVGGKIVYDEPDPRVPFSAICPVIMPYRFYGLSIADLITDIQREKSVVQRMTNDSLYLAVTPRIGVMENLVNLDDLLVARPGGIVRFKAPPNQAMQMLEHRFVGQQAMPMLEYWDSVKENRTGFTRYSQGTDADSLNKTATGASLITQASGKRMKLIARMFGETGVKDLFRNVIYLLSRYNSKPLMLRLANGWANVDPREWKHQYNLSVNVGLGTGDKNQENAQLQTIAAMQNMCRQSGMGHLVSDRNVYRVAKRLSENAGFKNEGEFFTPPGPKNPQPPPPPAPEMVKLQAEAQTSANEMKHDEALKQMELAHAERVAQIQAESNRQVAEIRAASAEAIKRMEIVAQAQSDAFNANAKGKAGEGRQRVVVQSGAEAAREDAVEQSNSALAMVYQTMSGVADALKGQAQAFSNLATVLATPQELLRDAAGKVIGARRRTNH